MKKRVINLFLFSIIILTVFTSLISADIGPKPTVTIKVSYEGGKIPDIAFQAKMLECVEKVYYDKQYLSGLAPQLNLTIYNPDKGCYWIPAYLAWGRDCEDSECYIYYHPPTEFRLAVYIPSLNRTFISNEVSRKNFDSAYNLELKSDGSGHIYETTFFLKKDKIHSFIIALIITLFLELCVAFIFFKLRKKALLSVVIVNLISLPIVWFIFPLISSNTTLVITLAEVFAFVLEAVLIYYINKSEISLGRAFKISFFMNLTSLVLGGISYILGSGWR